MLRLAPLCLAILGQQALAECPTSVHLGTDGIKVTYDPGGDSEVFRQTRPNIVESYYASADGSVWRAFLAHGAYMLEDAEVIDGAVDFSTRDVYAYPIMPSEMPVPMPDGGWAVTIVENSGRGFFVRDIDYAFGRLTTMDIGDCSYQAFDIAFPFEEGITRLNTYLPELGIALVTGEIIDGVQERYPVFSISVATP